MFRTDLMASVLGALVAAALLVPVMARGADEPLLLWDKTYSGGFPLTKQR